MPPSHTRSEHVTDPTWALFRRASVTEKLASMVTLTILAGLAMLALVVAIGALRS